MNIADIEVTCAVGDLAIGVVVARDVRCAEPDPSRVVAKIKAAPTPEAVRAAARDMLRHGKYKPTGRGKPASEYLLGAAVEDRFPRVFPLVDWCNIVSLEHGLPISLIDLRRAGVNGFRIRRGLPGESYVFNAGGQTIDLEDLLLTARMPSDEACANAVKDSLATKLTAEARDVCAIVYAPASLAKLARACVDDLKAAYGGQGDVLL